MIANIASEKLSRKELLESLVDELILNGSIPIEYRGYALKQMNKHFKSTVKKVCQDTLSIISSIFLQN